MKIEVMVPDHLYEMAEQETRRRGISQDALFAALSEFIKSEPVAMTETEFAEASAEAQGQTPNPSRLDPSYSEQARLILLRSEW